MSGEQQEPRSKQDIEADLAETREHLAETVDSLQRRMDLKSRAEAKVTAIRRDHGPQLVAAGGVLVVLAVVLVVRRRRHR